MCGWLVGFRFTMVTTLRKQTMFDAGLVYALLDYVDTETGKVVSCSRRVARTSRGRLSREKRKEGEKKGCTILIRNA